MTIEKEIEILKTTGMSAYDINRYVFNEGVEIMTLDEAKDSFFEITDCLDFESRFELFKFMFRHNPMGKLWGGLIEITSYQGTYYFISFIN